MSNSYWNLEPKDNFEPEREKSPWWSSRPVLILFLSVVWIAILSILWNALLPGKSDVNVEVPYIKAETGPVKIRPENPGGADIPHKDKQVYDLISDTAPKKREEHLAPAPERPEYSTQFENPAELSSTKIPAPAAIESVSEDAEEEISEEEESAKEEEEPSIVPPKSQKKKIEIPLKKTAISGKRYRVQLAALGSQKAAEGHIRILKKRYPSIRPLSAHVVKAHVKGKGFYRVQVGNFSEKQKAMAACKVIKDKGGDCNIVTVS